MSKKKTILSIALLVLLVLAGIVLPTIWKHESKKQAAQTEAGTEAEAEKESESAKPEEIKELKFLEFDKLNDFFSTTQIASLKTQCITYLLTIEKGDITRITFQPEKTSYPDKNTIRLFFSLSDDSSLPITYNTPTGTFSFGEEMAQIELDPTLYPKETDDNLPSVTTDEIETLQEGGYDDTKATTKEVTP